MAPAGVAARDGSDGQAYLQWDYPECTGGQTITGYRVQSQTAAGTWVTVVADTQSRDLGTVISGLTDNATYRFRVATVTANSVSPWSTASAEITVLPLSRTLQAVYLTSSEESLDRSAAISHTMAEVGDWFAGQLPGKSLAIRGGSAPTVVTIRDTDQRERALNLDGGLAQEWRASGVIAADASPIVFLEGGESAHACGWMMHTAPYSYSVQEWSKMVVMPMARCDIYPNTSQPFPYGAAYLTAHEIGHVLGGDHSYLDNRDLLFNGSGGRDWENLRLSPSEQESMIDSPLLRTTG
jgi:hypothetical protein